MVMLKISHVVASADFTVDAATAGKHIDVYCFCVSVSLLCVTDTLVKKISLKTGSTVMEKKMKKKNQKQERRSEVDQSRFCTF